MTAETNNIGAHRAPPQKSSARKIVNREWEIEDGEEGERQQVHFEEVERAIIRKNIKEGFRFRLVKKKTVIEPGETVGGEGDNEVKFGPKKDADDGEGVWPKTMGQHQENDSDDDPAVGNEETEESEIGETVGQIRSEHGLHGPADSPEVGDLKPAWPAGPHRDDDYDHRPIAELHR